MEPLEYSQSSYHEHSPLVDLEKWRQDMVAHSDTYLPSVVKALSRRSPNKTVNLKNKLTKSRIEEAVATLLELYSGRNNFHPQPGETVVVGGSVIYDLLQKGRTEPDLNLVHGGSGLRGTYRGIVVRDYVDEAIMDADRSEVTTDYIRASFRSFGPHIELTDVKEITPRGVEHDMADCEAAYIPLTYQRLQLSYRPAEDQVES